MTNLSFFRPDVLFRQNEIVHKSDSETKRELRIQQVKDQLHDDFFSSLQISDQKSADPIIIRRLKEEYNKLLFQNSQKLQKLDGFKREIEYLKPCNSNQDSQFFATMVLSKRQNTFGLSTRNGEQRQQEFLAKLKDQIFEITDQTALENHVTEQLEFMKNHEKNENVWPI